MRQKRDVSGPRRYTLLMAMGAAVLLLAASRVYACGTFEMWAAKQGQLPAKRLLAQLNCVDYNTYDPDKHAEFLFESLRDALDEGQAADDARNLFHKYECLPSMKQREGFDKVLGALGAERCTPEGYFRAMAQDLLVVDARVAQMRGMPSADSPVTDRAYRGAVVKKLGSDGDWIRVKTRWDNVGYIPAAQLREYSPAALREDAGG